MALIFVAGSGASDTTTYTYDSLGRLVTSTISGGPNDGRTNATCFDAAGNRTTYFSDDGGTPPCGATPTPTAACYASPGVAWRYSQGPEHNAAEVGGSATDVSYYGSYDCPGNYSQPMYAKATVTNNGTTKTIIASGTYDPYNRGQAQSVSSTQNVGGINYTISMDFTQDSINDYACTAEIRLTPPPTQQCS